MGRRVVVAFVLLSCVDAGRPIPRHGAEGFPRIACIGDSNTFWSGFASGPAWPTYLKRALAAGGFPNVDMRTYAMVGATALSTGREWNGATLDGEVYVQRAIDDHPTLAILAIGTNDVANAAEPSTIADRLVTLAARLDDAGIDTLVALVPPTRDPGATADPRRPPAIDAVNCRLRTRLPADRLVDFFDVPDSDFDADTAAPIRVAHRDGGHLNSAGQQRRAQRVADVLLGRADAGVGDSPCTPRPAR